MRHIYLTLLLTASACQCAQLEPLKAIPVCKANPEAPGCKPAIIDTGTPPHDAGHPPPVDAGMCGTGTITGQICAPDQMTFVPGADITVTGTCDGVPFTVHATADQTGTFTITVPAGTWNLTASSGSFTQTFPVTVTVGETTTASMDQQFCYAPTVTNLAVISGSGDKIESLLTQVGFNPTIIDGTTAGWGGANGGLAFLKNPTEMAKYNVIFIDCGAGRTTIPEADGGMSYAQFFFSADSAAIATNLQNFVMNGGSVYASDWAFIYIYLGWSQQFVWNTMSGNTGGGVTFPFDPYTLTGAQSQTVTANVVDTSLAAYLGKNTVTITFPSNMKHWGLMSAVNGPATEMITAPVAACSNSTCSNATAAATAPLAALYRVTNGPGGAVAYTSFHNISQTVPADIQTILKYIIFKL